MGPAIWVRGIGGLKPAQGAARVAIDPDSEPSAGGLVVDNNRIAKGIGKGATTAAIGHAGEGQSAVVGNRQAREVAAVRASGVVVGGQHLVRGIRVSPSVCLRLNNVRRSLRPSNQVHVRAAKSQGGRQVFHKPRERTGSPTFVRFAASFGLAAENHNGARPKVFHLVNPQLADLGTIKSRRHKRANVLGLGGNLILRLCL